MTYANDANPHPAAPEHPSVDPMIVVAAGEIDGDYATEAHHHPSGQLMGSTHGLLSVAVADGTWVVPPTHTIWLPPHHVHAIQSHGPFRGWMAVVAPQVCETLPKSPCTLRTSGLLREAILRAAEWPLAELDARNARIAEVILDEVRHLPVEPFGLPLPSDPRLDRIARELLKNPADPRDLDSWAEWAGISSRSLSRHFVTETGYTFTAWRQRARLLRSLERLAAGASVAQVAHELGYATTSAFISLFRRSFGETPAVFRQHL